MFGLVTHWTSILIGPKPAKIKPKKQKKIKQFYSRLNIFQWIIKPGHPILFFLQQYSLHA